VVISPQKVVAYVRIDAQAPPRLAQAQDTLDKSIRLLGLNPLPYAAGRKLVRLGDVLSSARIACSDKAFVWCNSDLIIKRDPFEVPDPSKVYGFHRRELPSKEVNLGGVDMYYIPLKWWDDYLSRDIPSLYIGAGYVDRWITRAMQKVGAYENLVGYLDHVTHETSGASGSDRNKYYQSNFRAYNRWAKRNCLDPIPAPPYLLPRIGHVWGIRDAIRKLLASRGRTATI